MPPRAADAVAAAIGVATAARVVSVILAYPLAVRYVTLQSTVISAAFLVSRALRRTELSRTLGYLAVPLAAVTAVCFWPLRVWLGWHNCAMRENLTGRRDPCTVRSVTLGQVWLHTAVPALTAWSAWRLPATRREDGLLSVGPLYIVAVFALTYFGTDGVQPYPNVTPLKLWTASQAAAVVAAAAGIASIAARTYRRR